MQLMPPFTINVTPLRSQRAHLPHTKKFALNAPLSLARTRMTVLHLPGIPSTHSPTHPRLITPFKWAAVIAINLTAPFAAAKVVLPTMYKKGWGEPVFSHIFVHALLER